MGIKKPQTCAESDGYGAGVSMLDSTMGKVGKFQSRVNGDLIGFAAFLLQTYQSALILTD